MSKQSVGRLARRPGTVQGRPADRLARLLESPNLDRVVRHLPPEMLHQLVQEFGVEVCAPIVGVATPEQMRTLLDLDLWKPDQAGQDDRLDADRFGDWIERLADVDVELAVRLLATMDEELAVLALSRWIRVLDPGVFGPTAPSDDERPERGTGFRRELELESEIGGYVVRAKRQGGWDALITVMTTLEARSADRFHALMRGCRRLSNSEPELDGLDDLLLAPDQQLHDVAIEREERRSGVGYVTPADARAFLDAARRSCQNASHVDAGQSMASAYWRVADRSDAPAPIPALEGDVAEALATVSGLLAARESHSPRPLALLEGPGSGGAPLGVIRSLLGYLHESHPDAYAARTHELAYLTNALMAGCSVQGRTFTPREASDAAVSTCNLGLERAGDLLPQDYLVRHDLLVAFQTGLATLYEEVTLVVTDRLIDVLGDIRCLDRDVQIEVANLRRRLVRNRESPWLVRDELDVLAQLDTPSWASLIALLAECPVIPAVLRAIVDGRTDGVSPTAFEFISTRHQIECIRQFLDRLTRAF